MKTKQLVRPLLQIMLCGALLLASCSKGTDLITYIPKNAMMVGNVDVKTLWQKGDVDNIDNISFVKLLRQELRSEDPEVAALVDEILKDPSSSGLNLKGDILFYVDQQKMTVLAQMLKVSQFEDFLKKTCEMNSTDLNIEEKSGYKTAKLDDKVSIAYTNDMAMFVAGIETDVNDELIADLMTVKKGSSIASNKNFKEYWKNHKEIGFWMDMGSMLDLAEREGGSDILDDSGMTKDYIDELKKGSYSANLVFDKGVMRIVFETQGISPKTFKTYMQKFNSALVKYMPEKSYLAFSYGFNMKEMVKMLAGMDDFDMDMNEKIAGNVTLQQLLESLGGSIAFSLFDFEGLMPQMAAAIDIKDRKAVESVLGELQFVSQNGYYVVPDLGFGSRIYYALNKDVFYITNSETAIRQFVDGGYKNAMGEISGKVKDGNYIYADLNINHYPSSITSLIPGNIVQLLAQYLDYTEIVMTSETAGEWRIYLADSKENSLLYTLHFIDDHLVELGNLAESFGGKNSCPEVTEEFYVDDYEDME